MNKKLAFVSFLLFILIGCPSMAQDDLYGDKREPKDKVNKTKTFSGNSQKPYSSRSPVTQTITWNDSISSNYALLFISRKFEANKLPVGVFHNNKLVGDLDRDAQFNYMVFTEGNAIIKVYADGITRQHTLNIQKGKKYYLEISMMNPNLLTEVNEAYATSNFRPSSVKRIKENLEKPAAKKITATGFVVSPDGYILTNYAAVDSATAIYVKGAGENLSIQRKAKLVIADKANNIALLQIIDSVALAPIPYGFKTSLLEVGDSIYVASYSTASSGQHVILHDATILSRSSYQGDINGYEISAPKSLEVNGAPVLDTKGNIIGIMNSKSKGSTIYPEATKARLVESLFSELGRTIPSQNASVKSSSEITQNLQGQIVLIEVE